MVLKGTKRSLRTGNTLRNIRDHRRTNNHSSVIVRHVTNTEGRRISNLADDSEIPANFVEFSLSKKGRWRLPVSIENNIHDYYSDDAAVALLRRHRLNRQSDCVSVVANASSTRERLDMNDFRGPRTKYRRKVYCNGLNVLHNGRGKSKKETRKKKVVSTKKDLAQQNQADAVPEHCEDDDVTPEVRYDVFEPLPASCSLRFHSKFMASGKPHSNDSGHKLAATANAKPTKGSYQRCKRVDYDDLYRTDDYYDGWMYDEDDYEDEYLAYTEYVTAEAYNCKLQTNAFGEYLYSDFVEQAFKETILYSETNAEVTSVKKRQRRLKSRKKKGGRFFYTTETENEFDSCVDDSQSEYSTESDSSLSLSPQPTVIKFPQMPSATVVLSGQAACARRLHAQYGSKYSEAACRPRKIVLDVTDRVQSAMKRLTVFNCIVLDVIDRVQSAMKRLTVFNCIFLSSLDLTTYVIFTYISPSDETSEQEDSGCGQTDKGCSVNCDQCSTNANQYSMFRLLININCTTQGLSLCLQGKTKFDNMEDVLEQILNFMVTLSPENLTRQTPEPTDSFLKSRLAPNFSTVADVNGWKMSCVSLLDRETSALPVDSAHNLQPGSILDQGEHAPSSSAHHDISPENQFQNRERSPARACTETYCLICFSEISPGSPQGPQATALVQCGHWFCDTCWQCHLSVATKDNGSRVLQCPEFQCQAEVDLATLLSLQSVCDVTLHQRRLAEEGLMRLFLCKWCPNPLCGRLVKLKAQALATMAAEPTSMGCPCGQRFCFRCHGDAHWPLSCDDLIEYQALLRQNDHLNTQGQAAVVVRGKFCPSCRRFIEKNGGCPYMVCVCGFKFFWCCRKPTSTYPHMCPANISDAANTRKMVVRENLRVGTQQESEWYDLAVRHRACQHRRHVRRDFNRAELLSRRLQTLHTKGVDIGLLLLLPLPENEQRTRTQQQPTTSESASGRKKARKESRRAVLKSDGASSLPPPLSPLYFKEMAVSMIQLKVELHHVLENTAAFLHLHGQEGSEGQGCAVSVRKVKDTVGPLQSLLSSLDHLLAVTDRRHLAQALPWFRRLQNHAKDTLTALTRLVNK